MNRSVRHRGTGGSDTGNSGIRPARTTARRRLRLLAVWAAVLLAAGAAGPALAAPPSDISHPAPRATAAQNAGRQPDDPRLTGAAKLRRTDGDVRFSFDARFREDETPDTAHGTFAFRHVGTAATGDLRKCVGSAPCEAVERGGFTVVPWPRPVR
ncbi:hypothetical protein ACH4FX_27100 [Streptomyces sp. NPDC018019]|uniref:hypothetical protein n=1 Tax=Streptomyces sp. NPDC018019 TaxID=3365030 RepID=UPI0037B59E32